MEDTAYKHWLNRVKIVSARFKIAPEDLLKMLYEYDSTADYRELYQCFDRFAFYEKFKSTLKNIDSF